MTEKRSGKNNAPARTPPDLPANTTALNAATKDDLLAGLLQEDVHARDIDLAGRSLPSLIQRSSIFERVSFANCVIPSARLRDVRLVGCDLSNAVLRGWEATRVEFIDCRLTGMKAIECRWRDVLIEGCDARYRAQFTDGRLQNCELRSSGLVETGLPAERTWKEQYSSV